MNEHLSGHMIETHGLTKRYGSRTAVAEVNLAVPRACAYGFLGHNGAGKTTVIRMLLGLTHADAGTMHISGRPVPQERGRVLSRVGAIVEEPSFHRYLTGRENLRVAAAVRGEGAMTRIPSVLGRVGLADRADEKVRTYSQGMRQRLGVARCLLADPELLILDEPMNGLDPGGILELRHMIRSLVDEGRTVFLSSHLLDEVEKTCDAAAVIDHGRIVEAGPIGSLLRRSVAAEVEIGCDQPERALALLAGHPAVAAAAPGVDGIRVTLVTDDGAAAVNTALVQAGVAVSRLEPVRHSLEERFLELTSTLGAES
jgi:ABC-2 type transport system ATP-binding protein